MSNSEPVRVGLVAKGLTGRAMFEHVLPKILGRRVSVTRRHPRDVRPQDAVSECGPNSANRVLGGEQPGSM